MASRKSRASLIGSFFLILGISVLASESRSTELVFSCSMFNEVTNSPIEIRGTQIESERVRMVAFSPGLEDQPLYDVEVALGTLQNQSMSGDFQAARNYSFRPYPRGRTFELSIGGNLLVAFPPGFLTVS